MSTNIFFCSNNLLIYEVILSSTLYSPVLGGALTQFLGFRTISCFLVAVSGSLLVVILIVLPETHRGIAGNGTVRLSKFRRPLWSIFRPSFYAAFEVNMGGPPSSFTRQTFIEPFRSFSQLDILPHLLIGGITYAVLGSVIITNAPLLQERSLLQHERTPLTPTLAGVAFIPIALGALLGFFAMKYRLESDYKIVETRFKATYGIDEDIPVQNFVRAGFPIERARLRSAWWIMLILIAATAGYGFSLDSNSIVRPLVIQFLLAASAVAVLMINSVLISDLHPKPVQEITNLVRFILGAVLVGSIQLLLDRLGNGVTWAILAALMFGFSPILLLQWLYGPKSREKRKISSGKLVAGAGIII